MYKKLIPTIVSLILINFLISCSIPSLNQTISVEESNQSVLKDTGTTLIETTPSTTTIPEPELLSSKLEGSDGVITYQLENNIFNGNINTINLTMGISNFADSKVIVVWSEGNNEIFRNEGVDNLSGEYYTTGITLSEGFIPSGIYTCEILINNKSSKIINFEIKQVDLEPMKISGKGAESTDFFEISGGLTIFDFKNTGGGNFITYLMDKDGNELDLIVNQIGNTQGKKAMYLPEGKYFLNIKNASTWEFNILQPRDLNLVTIPYIFSGTNPNISDLFLVDSLIEVNYNFKGEGNFVAYLMNQYGEQLDLLVNEIGNTKGSTTIKGDDNKYIISVELADGDYEFSLDYKK